MARHYISVSTSSCVCVAKWRLTGQVPPSMILSKDRAGGMPAVEPDLPDFNEISALPSSPSEPWLELVDGLAT